MKKFLLLIAATALAGTTYAQSISFKKDWGQILSVQKAPYVKHLMAPHRHNAPARVTESQTADDIIYSAEGEERSYFVRQQLILLQLVVYSKQEWKVLLVM